MKKAEVPVYWNESYVSVSQNNMHPTRPQELKTT